MSVPESVGIIQDAVAWCNYGRADILCRRTIEMYPLFAWAHLLLAETALKIGEFKIGRRLCTHSAAL